MLKRRNDEVIDAEGLIRRHTQSYMSTQTPNPVGEDGISQCYREVKVRMHVYSAPVYQATPIDGIQKQHLDPSLSQYNSAASGVAVSYSDVKSLRRRGTDRTLGQIINECPFSFYWVTANSLVWSPQQNDTVEGWVSVQSPGHIALLINDTFNASIKRADIPQSWEFIPQEDDEGSNQSLGYWKDDQGNRIDGKLQFTVKRFLHEGRTVLVLGSLLTADDVVPPQIPDNKHRKFDSEANSEYKDLSHDAKSSQETSKPAPKKIKFDD